jgi:hypothetical protein
MLVCAMEPKVEGDRERGWERKREVLLTIKK